MFYRPSQSQSHRLLIIHQVSKKPEKILSLSQEATTEFKYPVIYDKPHLQVQNDRPGTPNVWYHTGDFWERLYPVTRPKIMICPNRIVYRCTMFFTFSKNDTSNQQPPQRFATKHCETSFLGSFQSPIG